MLRSVMYVALCVTLVNSVQADDSAKELKQLQGTWKLVSLRTPKMIVKDARALMQEIVIDHDDWTEYTNGSAGYASRLSLGTATTSKTIDLTSQFVDEGVVEIQVVRGIYKLEGDTLTVVTASCNNKNRPQDFEFSGSANLLAVYVRVK